MNEAELLHYELSPDVQVQQSRETNNRNTEDKNLDKNYQKETNQKSFEVKPKATKNDF